MGWSTRPIYHPPDWPSLGMSGRLARVQGHGPGGMGPSTDAGAWGMNGCSGGWPVHRSRRSCADGAFSPPAQGQGDGDGLLPDSQPATRGMTGRISSPQRAPPEAGCRATPSRCCAQDGPDLKPNMSLAGGCCPDPRTRADRERWGCPHSTKEDPGGAAPSSTRRRTGGPKFASRRGRQDPALGRRAAARLASWRGCDRCR